MKENREKTKIYLGNFYGQKDSYDGAVFDPKGLCPSIRARMGGTDLHNKEQR